MREARLFGHLLPEVVASLIGHPSSANDPLAILGVFEAAPASIRASFHPSVHAEPAFMRGMGMNPRKRNYIDAQFAVIGRSCCCCCCCCCCC
jgi:hypothetical protein